MVTSGDALTTMTRLTSKKRQGVKSAHETLSMCSFSSEMYRSEMYRSRGRPLSCEHFKAWGGR
eukprot:884609-Prymnesium_polylepis.1